MPKSRLRVEYSLTRHGESLKPILKLMSAWGTRHRARYGTAKHPESKEPVSPGRTPEPVRAAPSL
jgi:DNA-binding HxlR family transcriptional regulator